MMSSLFNVPGMLFLIRWKPILMADRLRARIPLKLTFNWQARSGTAQRLRRSLGNHDIRWTTLSEHPHVQASGMIFDHDHPQYGAMRGKAQAVRYDGQRRHAPHTAGPGRHGRILPEAGFDDAQIDAMAALGAADLKS